MDQETKVVLGEILQITRENNEHLRVINNRARFHSVLKFFYWAVIIALTVGAYYWIQPYLNLLLASYSGLTSQLDTLQKAGSSLPDAETLKNLLEKFKQ